MGKTWERPLCITLLLKNRMTYKKLMEEENSFFGGDITDVWIAKYVPKGHNIMEYLPEVEDVITTTLKFDEPCATHNAQAER